MKKIFLLVALFLCSLICIGQVDEIEKIEVEPNPVFMDAYDYATGRMNDVPWMFKGLVSDIFRIGYEHKLGKSLSLNLDVNWGSSFIYRDLLGEFSNANLGIRYYPGLKMKIDSNLHGNNFNGRYIEMGAQLNADNWRGNLLNPYASFGLQTRFLKMGLIDVGFKLSYGQSQFSSLSDSGNSLNFRSGFDIGLALSSKYSLKRIDENRCAILKCYDEKSSMLSTRVSYLANISLSESFKLISLNPNLEYEHKISKVGFSLNHEVFAGFTYLNSDRIEALNSSVSIAGLRTSLKWYYLKKRRIAQGKTVNNLSGFYLGPTVGIGLITNHSDKPDAFYSEGGWNYNFGINVGYQTLLMNNLYFKVNLRYGYDQINLDIGSSSSFKILSPTGVSVGYVF